jgi:spermidine/putrescine transport system substrate-binding protein
VVKRYRICRCFEFIEEAEMRKLVLLLTLIVLVLGTAVTAAQDAPAAWVCPPGFEGQTLNVYNWTTYVAEDTISNFEAACGVTVTYDTYESADALVSRLQQGNPGYDIVVPADYTIQSLVAEGLIVPLDQAAIPNLKNLSAEMANPVYDPGNVYTAVYQWGTIGIGYDHNAVGADITSWSQVFSYDGPVAWLEAKREMMGLALNLNGYDANSINPDEINAAKEFLIANGGNVTYIAGDDGQELLARGEVHITIEFMGDIFQKISECQADSACTSDFRYVIPEEGANKWADNIAIPSGAQNEALANVFIDYILDAKVGADISNYTSFATPNQASIDAGLILPELLENPGIYPPAEVLPKLFFVSALDPDAEQYYNDAWDEIKIRIGS